MAHNISWVGHPGVRMKVRLSWPKNINLKTHKTNSDLSGFKTDLECWIHQKYNIQNEYISNKLANFTNFVKTCVTDSSNKSPHSNKSTLCKLMLSDHSN